MLFNFKQLPRYNGSKWGCFLCFHGKLSPPYLTSIRIWINQSKSLYIFHQIKPAKFTIQRGKPKFFRVKSKPSYFSVGLMLWLTINIWWTGTNNSEFRMNGIYWSLRINWGWSNRNFEPSVLRTSDHLWKKSYYAR